MYQRVEPIEELSELQRVLCVVVYASNCPKGLFPYIEVGGGEIE